jgi:hypothetical protein
VYGIRAGGVTSGNYAISFVDGRLTVDPAALRVVALDTTREQGASDPAFQARYEGLVNGERPDVLDGTLVFRTDAQAGSPVGSYRITPGGVSSGNYAITFVDGTLSVRPAGPVDPGVPSGLPAGDPFGGADRYATGVPPYTPGDAGFRTTIAEAPPALSGPFALTYSLGEVASFAPAGGPSPAPGGFIPAAGGPEPEGGAFAGAEAGPCGGVIQRPGLEACTRSIEPESYWATRDGGFR